MPRCASALPKYSTPRKRQYSLTYRDTGKRVPVMRRIAIRLGIAVAAFAAILAGAGYELTAAYTYEAPKPDYLKPSSLAEAQRDDLDYLKKLPDADWSYTPETRAK